VVPLSGDWWASWEYSQRRGQWATQPAYVRQDGADLAVEALDRGTPFEHGGYLWTGELHVWDNDLLIGWYAAADGSVRSKGSLYFALDVNGQHMTGRWVGMSRAGRIVDGWGVMARTREACDAIMGELCDIGGEPHGRAG
jgi:hypothetical protein